VTGVAGIVVARGVGGLRVIVLGLSGGTNLLYDEYFAAPGAVSCWHDAAAVILVDGNLVSAHAEERHNRVKHSAAFPDNSVRACLADADIDMSKVDAVAVYFTEEYWTQHFQHVRHYEPDYPHLHPRATIVQRLREATGHSIRPEAVHFVDHHWAHGYSALTHSGIADCLLLTLDGAGDFEAGRLVHCDADARRVLWTVPLEDSLGELYLHVTKHLGYGLFDEYKVMGLAPYGDPKRLSDVLRLVDLSSGDRFAVDPAFPTRLRGLVPARRLSEPLTELHADIAATLQRSLEDAVMQLLAAAAKQTGASSLCFAGGVAHNATLNGKIQRSGLFSTMFVPPAAHDAGCAIGAAALTDETLTGRRRPSRRLTTAYLGTAISSNVEALMAAVTPWRDFIDFRALDEPALTDLVAERLASGDIVGMAAGRAEFGPRALGNRSILADPRPVENKDRINAIIKEREGYRPFAPVVTADAATRYFDLAADPREYSFMSYAVPVREQWRDRLGAVTHVDGSARLQTVERHQNQRLWDILNAFESRAGIPVLLNTSFNVSAEPIVDSAEDAIVCLLTSNLSLLVLGNLLVEVRDHQPLDTLTIRLEQGTTLKAYDDTTGARTYVIEKVGIRKTKVAVSAGMFALLGGAATSVREHCGNEDTASRRDLLAETISLWRKRLVRATPQSASGLPVHGHAGAVADTAALHTERAQA
jgi:carbamoyltransferase